MKTKRSHKYKDQWMEKKGIKRRKTMIMMKNTKEKKKGMRKRR